MNWQINKTGVSRDYICGYCGLAISSNTGFIKANGANIDGYVYICHKCTKPTYFSMHGDQVPGPLIGNPVKYIMDENIEKLFNEAKKCYSFGAFTSSVMCCRKLLMNISVLQGADEGKGFVDYVNYLDTSGFIPPHGKEWVDSIRKLGNEANHKIEFRTEKESQRIINFTEMLLRFIYELPGIMRETEQE